MNIKRQLSRLLIPNWTYLSEFIEVNQTLTDKQRFVLGEDYHALECQDDYRGAELYEETIKNMYTISRGKVWRRLYWSYSEKMDANSTYDIPAGQIGLALVLRDTLKPEMYDEMTRLWRQQVGKLHPEDKELNTNSL